MEPASRIIKRFGGVKKVAEITGRTESIVHRWTYPKSRGGTDGRIPQGAQDLLLAHARATDMDFDVREFFSEAAA